jgi:hypothetical protein
MRRRAISWRSSAPTPVPAHPYRDSLIIFGAMAGLIVLVGWATGGGVKRAVIIAVAFFVIAFLYSVARWHSRLSESRRRDERGL